MVEIGFIGLGTMGNPMGTHLLKAGHDLTVYDIDEAAISQLVAAGAKPAKNPDEAIRGMDVVILSLPGSKEVTALIEETEDAFDEGTVLIDTTTANPMATAEVAERLSRRGVDVLGAPVSGGRVGAEEGSLATMVGGDPAVVEATRDILETFSGSVTHVGEQPAHGHACKLLNNYLSYMVLYVSSEAVVLGEEMGLEMGRLLEAINHGTGRNSATTGKLQHVREGNYDIGAPIHIMEKDLSQLMQFSEDAGVPLAFGGLLRQFAGYTRCRYGEDEQITRAYDFFSELSGGPTT